jgi:multimeric flavodoxin WrbA
VKKIIGLSCGTKNGNCETFLRAAATGAEEFGIETEIIRAMELKVLPFPAAPKDDDVAWILEKTCVEDAGLIVAVPCYHARANGIFYSINERMNPVFSRDMNILKKTRVGAIIGVGGSGYDGWASLVLLSVNIFLQHTRKLVDQIEVNFCGFKEWNLWMQQGAPLTSHTHLARVQDLPYDEPWKLWPQDYNPVDFKNKALERAKELGRNVAKAMMMPIEEVKYVGEEAGVACPVCHCNILLVPENLPHVYCPCCAVRGTISVVNGKMGVEWHQEDAETPRFSYDAIKHHLDWLRQHHGGRPDIEPEQKKKYESHATIIKPPVKSQKPKNQKADI